MKAVLSFSITLLLLVLFIVFASCSNGSTDSKIIEAKYRFSDGRWYNLDNTPNGDVTVGESTITTTTAGINLSGVYTSGGGKSQSEEVPPKDLAWAYLYDGSGKIGVIYVWDDDSKLVVVLGKSTCNTGEAVLAMAAFGADISDMKDTHKGRGHR